MGLSVTTLTGKLVGAMVVGAALGFVVGERDGGFVDVGAIVIT